MTTFTVDRRPDPVGDDERNAILADPGFGRHFTDHLAIARWSAAEGWDAGRVIGMRDLPMHPATAVLHYGQEIFEGLKAYRHADDSVWLFRPERNAARFAGSARRLALPVLPERMFLDSLIRLVATDQAWVPTATDEQSLYLRPILFGSEAFVGVRPSREATYLAMASPAGPYFADGVAGIALWVARDLSRAAPGGTGAAKCGGNYAAGLISQQVAADHGCDQVLFLDAVEHRWLEESGTMNLCLVTDAGGVITPESETILDGITRDTVLQIAGDHGLTPVRRRVSIEEVITGLADGSITELFACGTAAVITPIAALVDDAGRHAVGDGAPGPTTLALREHLLDVQYGRRPDVHGWLTPIG